MGFYRTAVGAELDLAIERRAITAQSPRNHRGCRRRPHPALVRSAGGSSANSPRRGEITVIDEVQFAPDLFPVLKRDVDRNPVPGRFLLTGSANVFMLPKAAESLAGRMEVLTLDPLSQSEIEGSPHNLVDALFGAAPWSPRSVPTDRGCGAPPRFAPISPASCSATCATLPTSRAAAPAVAARRVLHRAATAGVVGQARQAARQGAELHLVDAGLPAHLRGQADAEAAGQEVDLVLETPNQRIVGIEIKASASLTQGDFDGLRELRGAASGPCWRTCRASYSTRLRLVSHWAVRLTTRPPVTPGHPDRHVDSAPARAASRQPGQAPGQVA